MNYLDIPNSFIENKDLLFKSIFNRRFTDFQFYVEYNSDSLNSAEQYSIKIQYTSNKSMSLFSILEKDKKYTLHNMLFLFDYLYKDLEELNRQLKTNIYQFPCIFAPIISNEDIKNLLDEFNIKYDKINFSLKNNKIIVLFTNYKFIFLFDKKECNRISIMPIIKFYVNKIHSINYLEQSKIKDIPEFNIKSSNISKYLTPIEINLKLDNNFYEILVKIYIEKHLNTNPKIFINNVLDVLSDFKTVFASEYYKKYMKYNNDITTILLISICKKLNLNILYNMCLNFIPIQFSCHLDKYRFSLKSNKNR